VEIREIASLVELVQSLMWGRALLPVQRPQGDFFLVGLSGTRTPTSLLPADVLAGHIAESALGIAPKLVVASGLLAHHKSPAVIARIKPFRGRNHAAATAVEAHASSHLDERPTLRKFGRFFVFHANPGRPQILPHPQRTHRHPVSCSSLANRMPVAGGKRHHADQHHRRQHDRNQD